MKKVSKKYLIILIALLGLIYSILFIIISSMITDGHKVTDYRHEQEIIFANRAGYEINDGVYTVSDESNHYLTFMIEKDSEEFAAVFKNSPEADENVTVWYMTEYGEVISEENVVWKAGRHVLFLEELPEDTVLVALGIDTEFEIYEIINSVPYHNTFIRNVLYIVTFLLILVIGIVFYRKRAFFNPLTEFLDAVLGSSDVWKKRGAAALRLFITAVVSLVLAAFIVKVLSGIGISIYSTEIHSNWKYITLVFVMIFTAALLIIEGTAKEKSLAVQGLTAILLIGSAYAFIEPVANGVSWDDEIHYINASSLSHIADRKKSLADREIFNIYQSVALDRTMYSASESRVMLEMFDEIYDEGFFREFNEDEAPTIMSLSYLPMSLGLSLSRGMGLPFGWTVVIGRWFNLLFLALISYIAMRRLEHGAAVAALLMLVPTNIFMAGSYSYDTWLTALSMLGFALLFRERTRSYEDLKTSAMWLIPLVFLLSAVSKPVYFIMTFAAFFLQTKKFKSNKQKWIYRILVGLAAILPFVFVMVNNVLNAGMGDTRGGSDVNAAKQIEFILGNFPFFIKVLYNFLLDYLNPFTGGMNYMNFLSYNGMMSGGLITLIIVLAGALINHQTNSVKTFPIWYKLCAVLLYIGVGAICAVSMYVSYTAVGADYVAGCQGRYLYPALFPTLYILTRVCINRDIFKESTLKAVNTFLMTLMVIINVFCIWQGCVKYY